MTLTLQTALLGRILRWQITRGGWAGATGAAGAAGAVGAVGAVGAGLALAASLKAVAGRMFADNSESGPRGRKDLPRQSLNAKLAKLEATCAVEFRSDTSFQERKQPCLTLHEMLLPARGAHILTPNVSWLPYLGSRVGMLPNRLRSTGAHLQAMMDSLLAMPWAPDLGHMECLVFRIAENTSIHWATSAW